MRNTCHSGLIVNIHCQLNKQRLLQVKLGPVSYTLWLALHISYASLFSVCKLECTLFLWAEVQDRWKCKSVKACTVHASCLQYMQCVFFTFSFLRMSCAATQRMLNQLIQLVLCWQQQLENSCHFFHEFTHYNSLSSLLFFLSFC